VYRKPQIFKEGIVMNNNGENSVFAQVQDERCDEISRTEYEFSSMPIMHDYCDICEYYCDLIGYFEEREMFEEAEDAAIEYDELVYGRWE
jgi:hypothetical protein